MVAEAARGVTEPVSLPTRRPAIAQSGARLTKLTTFRLSTYFTAWVSPALCK